MTEPAQERANQGERETYLRFLFERITELNRDVDAAERRAEEAEERLGQPPAPVLSDPCVHSKAVLGCPGCLARLKRQAKLGLERPVLSDEERKRLNRIAHDHRGTHSDDAAFLRNLAARERSPVVRELEGELNRVAARAANLEIERDALLAELEQGPSGLRYPDGGSDAKLKKRQ